MAVTGLFGHRTGSWQFEFDSIGRLEFMAAMRIKGAPHPTRGKLIATFLRLGEAQDFSTITVEMVLGEAGVSKGSLYHHFHDFDDLLAQAKAHLFSIGINRSVEMMRTILDKSETAEEFKSLIRALILDTLTPQGVHHRLMRARILGASMRLPKLQEYVQAEQRRLTEEIAGLFIGAKGKGLVKKGLDPHLAAVFIQAYTFGKVFDDVSDAPIAPDDWADWIMSILTYKIIA